MHWMIILVQWRLSQAQFTQMPSIGVLLLPESVSTVRILGVTRLKI